MRYVLVALVVVLGCSKAPPAATPANQAPAPDYQRTASDELAFLAGDADFVIGLDMVALRGSQLWRSFEPQITAFMRQAQDAFGGGCEDFMKKLERMTFSLKLLGGNQMTGVAVMHGSDMPAGLECTAQNAGKTGKTAKKDRDVLLLTQASKPELASASRAVGSTTLVSHLDKNASYDSLAAVLAAGVPLRGSAEFMKLYERRERGAALWGMANGNASVFAQMASSGMRPKSVDGTIVVTDRMAITVRMTMAGPAEATNVASEIDKIKPMAGAYVERLETRVEGPLVQIEVAVTEAQLRALIGMLGGLADP